VRPCVQTSVPPTHTKKKHKVAGIPIFLTTKLILAVCHPWSLASSLSPEAEPEARIWLLGGTWEVVPG
jgi:hypothetical protein